MTSEWFNMVLSLLKRQQHIKSSRPHSCHSRLILTIILHLEIQLDWNEINMKNEVQMKGMTSEWFNMVLSLLKRQQHIKSFRPHSCHSRLILTIILHLEIELDWNEINMENEVQMKGMTSEWFNMVLSLLKRQHHIKFFWVECCIVSAEDEMESTSKWNEIRMIEWVSNERNEFLMNRLFNLNDGMMVEWDEFLI